MENQLVIMLGALADKLGTTVEMLWGVLLKQAQISALFSIAWVGFVLLFGKVLYVNHKKLSKPSEKHWGRTMYYEKDGVELLMALLLSIWVISATIGIFEIKNAVTALLNPEYWALQEILGKCR